MKKKLDELLADIPEDIEHYYKLYRVACPKCAITSSKKGFTIMEAMDVWDQLGEQK